MPPGFFRRALVGLSILTVTSFVLVFFLAYSNTGQMRWELLFHATLLTLIVVLIARSPGPQPSGRCPVCGSRVFPTRRSLDAARMWTCSGCAFEIPRTWQRPRTQTPPGPPGLAP